MRVGVTIDLLPDEPHSGSFERLKSVGLSSCQLVCWDRSLLTEQVAEMVKEEDKENKERKNR